MRSGGNAFLDAPAGLPNHGTGCNWTPAARGRVPVIRHEGPGFITYEILTGHRLFENTDRNELIRMHREQEPLSPRRFVPDLPESVCTALLRAVQKDPNQRFTSCEEFAVAFGCRLLNAPVPLPEILRLTAVRRMRGDWNSGRFLTIRKGTALYLVLSRSTLWVAYLGEIRCWPLQALAEVRHNWWGNELRLRFHRASQVVRQAFRFTNRKECQQWCEMLQDWKSHSPSAASVPTEWPQVEPVVLMRRPPAMRYQALGPVEFQDAKPRRADVGLQIRAAMMGADAVVDVQEERLPQLGRTVRRRSGMAIKAIGYGRPSGATLALVRHSGISTQSLDAYPDRSEFPLHADR
jgi:hypothetical protein